MALLIAVTGWDADEWAGRVRELAPRRDVRAWPDVGNVADIDYALVWKASPGLLGRLPNLKIIFSLGAGVDHVFADPDLPDIPVVRSIDRDLTMRMSEYVAFHVLLHHRQHHVYDAFQRVKRWQEVDQPAAWEVNVGVMGLGELGGDAARKLKMLGFNVAGWSRTPKAVEGIACHCGADGLGAFLARTDILVVLLPLTPATQGIVNRKLLARLRRDGPLGGPVLINAGRGKLQVEPDIVAALEAGELKAASLDVFQTEPLPHDSPLWTHPRVTVTPHNAAASDPRALARYVVEMIVDYEAGKPLRNVVERARGY